MAETEDIIRQLEEGKEAAFHALYKAHFSMIKYFVTTNSGSEAAASDIFQETIIVLFEKAQAKSLKANAGIKTIIYSIARNLWLKELRNRKSSSDIKDCEPYLPVEDDPIDEDLHEKQRTILDQCLNELGDPCKELLTQFYYFKKSLNELAELLGYSNSDTVKAQKYKCLKRLRTLAVRV